MKNFYFIYLPLTILFLLCGRDEAKGQVEVLMGIEIVIPREELNDLAIIGLGGSGGLELSLTEKMGLTAQIGYIYLRPKNESLSAYMMPLQAGLKYYFGKKDKGIYVHPKFGTHKLTVTTEEVSRVGYYVPAERTSRGGTSYGIGIGYVANREIDIEFRYNVIANDGAGSYVGIRLGFSFI